MGKTEYSVKSLNIREGFAYISFTTVEDRNQAELLRNLDIWVEKDKAPELDEDEYFTDDLVGCTLVTENNDIIGHIVNIEKYGSADVVEIIGKGGQQSFPYVKGLIKSVDFDEKKIEFDHALNGIIGLETSFAVGCTYLYKTGKLTLPQLTRLMADTPCRILNITPAEIKVGDVISFFDPASNSSAVVTHRVIEVVEHEGKIYWNTKGDHNISADKVSVPAENLVGRWEGTRFPGLGSVAMFLQSTWGLILCIGLPLAALVTYELLRYKKANKSKQKDVDSLMEELAALKAEKEKAEKEKEGNTPAEQAEEATENKAEAPEQTEEKGE